MFATHANFILAFGSVGFWIGVGIVVLGLLLGYPDIARFSLTRASAVTRLEIVVGKVMGFVGLSGWMLLLMGLFTWVYLVWIDHRERGAAGQSAYYVEHGTLHARVFGKPDLLAFVSAQGVGEGMMWE